MIVGEVDLPVSADLENGFAEEPDQVADTVRGAIGKGLAGGSIEDFNGDDSAPIYRSRLRPSASPPLPRPRTLDRVGRC